MKVRIFTDGSCSNNPGPGGWGVVFSVLDKYVIFKGNEENTTNNRMELKAIIESYKKILKLKDKKHKEFEIYSDSAYVVNTINENWIEKWKKENWKTVKGKEIKNRDLWEEYDKLKTKCKNLKITVIKVKGHAGNPLNEMVDQIARNESKKAKRRGAEND